MIMVMDFRVLYSQSQHLIVTIGHSKVRVGILTATIKYSIARVHI